MRKCNWCMLFWNDEKLELLLKGMMYDVGIRGLFLN